MPLFSSRSDQFDNKRPGGNCPYMPVDRHDIVPVIGRVGLLMDDLPAAVKVWRDAWDRFVPILDYPPAIRRVL